MLIPDIDLILYRLLRLCRRGWSEAVATLFSTHRGNTTRH